MEDRVRQFMKEHQLVNRGDRIAVGVSGGADSVCLLYLLNAFKKLFEFELYVVHVNHGLRGKEAEEDEAYVREICHKLGLHFHAYHIDVAKLSHSFGMTLEEAGRKARYDAFLEECRALCCNKVAVAHHMNDTVETILFHLIRGTGIQGLTGISAKRKMTEEVEVIRPLLCVKREEIEAYLNERNIPYCVDASNLTDDYSRNKLRNQVLPFLKSELNEGVIEHIAKTAAHLDEINEYINHNIEKAYPLYVTEANNEISLSIQVQQENPVIIKGLLRKILGQMLKDGLKDIESGHIDQLLRLMDLSVGKMLNLPRGLIVRKQYEAILFTFSLESMNKIDRVPMCMELNIHQPGEYDLNEIGKTLRVDIIEYKKNMIIPKNAYTKWFDYDKIKNTVFIRNRQTGDYLQIKEDGGSKKLKDYFIDRKIPREERDSYLLVADGSHIMWILEDRISEAYKVGAKTKKILVISLIGGNNHGYQR